MNRRMIPEIFCAVAALCSISAAHAKVLVYEGFHPEDYNNVAAGGNVTASDCTLTGNNTTGVTYGSTTADKWNGMGGTQIKVYGENYGLALPSVMTGAGFTAHGGSIGTNPGGNDNQLRAMRHALTSEVLKVSEGKLYVRMLLNIDSKAAGKLAFNDALSDTSGGYYGFGLCTVPSGNNYNLLIKTKSALAFAIWKNKSGQCNISFTHTTAGEATVTSYPILTNITLGSTYICYAEINVGTGTDGKEIIRAGAVKSDDFVGAIAWAKLNGENESIETELITDSSYPNTMAVAGPYGSNGGYFRADELVVGTELGDILPADGVFAVSATGMPIIDQTSFSTDWILVADDGVTADAGIVYSTDETFVTATTNLLGTGLSADTRTATLSGLEPDTTYWWKIVAEGNGAEEAESVVASFKTKGAPVLGTATAAAVNGNSAEFSAALAEAALGGMLSTDVSVFYGTDGENWTEVPMGSSASSGNWTQTVSDLAYGTTYRWFVRATATMQGGRVLSADSAEKSFTTLWGGEMYVDAAAANAAVPYSTPETAAPNLATALAVATDGATIHVAPGLYPITVPLTVSKAVRILGDDPDPSCVVVSNKTGAGHKNGNQRVFYLDNANAFVANLTMQKGQSWGSSGSSFYITANGGTVSNCVVEAGQTTGNNAFSAGAVLNAGRVAHTVFRKCTIGSNSTSDGNGGYRAAVLNIKGDAVAENCLLADNTQASGKALTIVRIEGSATMRNCTIVDSGLGNTNQYCAVFTPIYLTSANATVQNVVVAGVTNRIDGALCRPVWGRPANFLNGATDADISGLNFPEGTVTGTATEFFKGYANGDYTPASGGPLVGKGANYEDMASVDLAGNPRKIGSRIDIGCYELRSKPLVLTVR